MLREALMISFMRGTPRVICKEVVKVIKNMAVSN